MRIIPEVEYLEEKLERITYAWEDSEIFKKFLKLNSDHAQKLQQLFLDLIDKRMIDTAEGAQLDIIGNIVGQKRVLIDANLTEFFGFEGDPQSGPFGTLEDQTFGAPFFTLDQKKTGNVILDDDKYRLFIRSKIMKNTTIATPEDLIRFANFVFQTKGSTVLDERMASFTLLIGRPLTREEIGLIKYKDRELGFESSFVPKPIGVGVNFGSYNYDSFFAFQGVPNAKGFGVMELPQHNGEFNYDGALSYEDYTIKGGGELMILHGEI